MKARHPGLQMLQAPWQWRRNDGSLWAWRLYGLLTVLIFAAPAAGVLVWLPPRAAWASIGALALVGLTALWGLQFVGLQRLDHPHAAHTVPGHARALRSTALGLWATLVTLAGFVMAIGTAMWLQEAELATIWRSSLAAALGTGALLLFVAAALRWWWLWVLAGALPALMGAGAWRLVVFDTWHWALPLWQAQPLGGTLMLLAVLGLLLSTLFGRGDAVHAGAYQRRERVRRVLAASPGHRNAGLAAYGRWGEWLSKPGQAMTDAWLRRALARANTGRGSVMTRAEVVLHGHQHWVRQLATLLFVQACVGLSLVLTAFLAGVKLGVLLEHGRTGLAIGVGIMAFSAVLNLPSALWASRREQALLVLLPGMPQGAALNRALAWRQWRHCGVLWLALVPGLGAVLWAGLAPHALAPVVLALPLTAWLWRDHARMRAGRPVFTVMALALGPALGTLSMALLSRHPAAWWPWWLGVLALTAALLAWRWRVLPQLPPALPVGRLA